MGKKCSRVIGFLLIILSLVFLTQCQLGLGDAVDTQIPTITITEPESGSAVSGIVTIKGKWDDDQTVKEVDVEVYEMNGLVELFKTKAEVSKDGSWYVNINSPSDTSKYNGWELPDGTYQVTVQAKDAYGHISGKFGTTIDIDNTAPVFALTAPNATDTIQSHNYGTFLYLEGSIAESHGIKEMDVWVYDEEGKIITTDALSFEDVQTSGQTNIIVANYESENQDTYLYENYIKLYGSDDSPLFNTTQKYYMIVSLKDNAGNVSTSAYFQTELFDSVASIMGTSSSMINVQTIQKIINGTYNADTDTAKLNALRDAIKANEVSPLATHDDSGNRSLIGTPQISVPEEIDAASKKYIAFTLNSNADPTYTFSGYVLKENETPNTTVSESTITLQVSAGLNQVAFDPRIAIQLWNVDGSRNYEITGVSPYLTIEPNRYYLNGSNPVAGEFITNSQGINVMEITTKQTTYTYTIKLPKLTSGKAYALKVVQLDDSAISTVNNFIGARANGVEQRFVFSVQGSGNPPNAEFGATDENTYLNLQDSIVKITDLKFSGTVVTESKLFSPQDPGTYGHTHWEVIATPESGSTGETYKWNGNFTFNDEKVYSDPEGAEPYEWTANLTNTAPAGLKTTLANGANYLLKFTAKFYNESSVPRELTRQVHIDTKKPELKITSITPYVDNSRASDVIRNADSTIIAALTADESLNYKKRYLNGNISLIGQITETNMKYLDYWLEIDDATLALVNSMVPGLNLTNPIWKNEERETTDLSISLDIDSGEVIVERFSELAAAFAGKSIPIIFKAQAVDAAGNESVVICETYLLNEATDRPIFAFNNPKENVTEITTSQNMFGTSINRTVTGTISDDDGISDVKIGIRKYGTADEFDYSGYEFNQAGNSSVSIEYTLPTVEGEYELRIEATDIYGETIYCSNSVTYYIAVDAGGPTLTVKNSGSDAAANNSHVINGNAIDIAGGVKVYRYSNAGKEENIPVVYDGETEDFTKVTAIIPDANGDWSDTITTSDAGNTVTYCAIDKYGNKSYVTYEYSIDTVKPEFEVTSLNKEAESTLITENNANYKVKSAYALNNENTALSDVGNEEADGQFITVMGKWKDLKLSGGVNVNGSGTELIEYSFESAAGPWVKVTGSGINQTYSSQAVWSFDLPVTEKKNTDLYIRAKDAAGNYSDPVKISSLTFDFSSPDLQEKTLVSNDAGGLRSITERKFYIKQNENITSTGTLKDTHGLKDIKLSAKFLGENSESQIELSESDFATYGIVFTKTLTEGEKEASYSVKVSGNSSNNGLLSLSIAGKDIAGRTSSSVELSFLIDTVAPVWLSDAGHPNMVDGDVYAESLWFSNTSLKIEGYFTESGSGIDAVSSVIVPADESASSITDDFSTRDLGSIESFSINFSGFESGSNNTITFTPKDKAGNTGVSKELKIQIDRDVPVVSYEGEQTVRTNKVLDITINGTVTDSSSGVSQFADDWKCFIDGVAKTVEFDFTELDDGKWSITIPASSVLKDLENSKSYQVSVQVKDVAGNSTDVKICKVEVDSLSPVARISSPVTTGKINGTHEVYGKVTELDPAEFKLYYSTDAASLTGVTKANFEEKWTLVSRTDGSESITDPSSIINWDLYEINFNELSDAANQDNGCAVIYLLPVATDSAGNCNIYTTSLDDISEDGIAYTYNLEGKYSTYNVDMNADRPIITFSQLSLVSEDDAKTAMSSANYVWLKNTTKIYGSVTDDDGIKNFYWSTKASPDKDTNSDWTEIELGNGGTWDIDTGTDGPCKISFKVVDEQNKIFVSTADETLDSIILVDPNGYSYGYSEIATVNSRYEYKNEGTLLYVIVDTNPPSAEINGLAITETDSEPESYIQNYSTEKMGGKDRFVWIKVKAEDTNYIEKITGTLKFTDTVSITAEADGNEIDTDGNQSDEYVLKFEIPDSTVTGNGSLSTFDGTVAITIEAKDRAGNSGKQSGNFTADYLVPVIKRISPKASETISGGVSVYGTVDSDCEMYYGISTSKNIVPGSDKNITEWYDTNGISHSITVSEKAKISDYKQIKDASTSWFVYFDGDTDSSLSSTHDIELNDYLTGYKVCENIETFTTNVELYFFVKAVDKVGNVSVEVFNFKYDPHGDKPIVTLDYPSNEDRTLGGSVKIYGTATDPKGTTAEKIGIDSVWVQIISTAHELSGYNATGKRFGTLPTAETLNQSTAFVLTADELSYLKQAGYKIYNMKKYIAAVESNSLSSIEWSGSLKTGESISDYGILSSINGASWNLTINQKKEFDTSAKNAEDVSVPNDIAIRVIALDKDGKFSDAQVCLTKFDSSNPIIGSEKHQPLYLVKSDTATFSLSESYDQSLEYTDDMFVRGEWYLIGSVEDDDKVKKLTIGTDTLLLNGEEANAASDTYDVYIADEGKTVYFKYKVSTELNLDKTEFSIYAEDGASGNVGKCDETITINFDNLAPELIGADQASYNIFPAVQDSDGFYSISSQVKEEPVDMKSQSGIEQVAFYFVRRDISGATEKDYVFDPMIKKGTEGNSTDISDLVYEDGLYWAEKSVTRTKDTPKVLTFDEEEDTVNIHVGTLVKINGTIYSVSSMDADSNSLSLSGTPMYSSAATSVTETVQFAYALVVNNTIQEVAKANAGTYANGYPREISSDDKDGMEEYLEKRNATYTWSASIVSKNIPDGPIEIHYVAFDKAGNYSIGIAGNWTYADFVNPSYKTITDDRNDFISNISNDAVNVLYVSGKDYASYYNAESSTSGNVVTSETLKKEAYVSNNAPRIAGIRYAADINGNSEIEENETTHISYADNWMDATRSCSIGTYDSPKITAKGLIEFVPEIIGGNGDIKYNYSIKKSNSGNTDWAATSYYADSTLKALGSHSAEDSQNVLENPNAIQFTTKNFLTKRNSSEIVDGMNLFEIVIWDSTQATTCGVDSQSAVVNAAVNVQLRDTEAPSAYVKPFYWRNNQDNSLFGESRENGHIELTSDWNRSEGYANYTSNKTGYSGTEYDGDAKVSGKIKVEGVVHDNTLITQISSAILDKANVVLAEYKPSEGKWYSGETVIGYYDTDPDSATKDKWVYTSTLSVKTEGDKVVKTIPASGYAFELRDATYKDLKDAEIIDYVPAGKKDTDVVEQITEEYGHNIAFTIYVDTENKAIVTNITGRDKTVVVTATDLGSPSLNASNEVVYTSKTGSGRSRMDVVPYITKVTTQLSSLSKKTPSMYDRTALGHYPVRIVTKKTDGTAGSSETVTFMGFNLGTNTSLAVNTLTTADDATTGGRSAKYAVTVNGISSLNNVNNNNAHGIGSNITEDSSYADKNTYAYNRVPNNVNNNRLTDDVIFDVWEFNSAAAIPISGKIEQPVMKIRPTDGKIGFAFVNGPLYFSMGGSASSQDYSYLYWVGSFDFFTSVGFTYDEKGNSFGVAAGGDINSNSADKFNLLTSRFGLSGRGQNGMYGGANAFRMESIGMKGTKSDTSDTTNYFDKQRIKSPSMVATSKNTNDTNLYLAYYDAMNNEIRFKSGTMTNGNEFEEKSYKLDYTDNAGSNYQYGHITLAADQDILKNGTVVEVNGTKYYADGVGHNNGSTDWWFRLENMNNLGTYVASFPIRGGYNEKGGKRTPTNTQYVKVCVPKNFGNFTDYEPSGVPYTYGHDTPPYAVLSNSTAGEYVSIAVKSGTKDTVVAVWYDQTSDVSSSKLMYAYNDNPIANPSNWSTPVVVFDQDEDFAKAGEYCKVVTDAQGGVHIAAYDPVNLDLVYAYLPQNKVGTTITTSDFKTAIVDSNGVVGSNLTLDVALVGGKPVPYIGYYATSCIKPKYARFVGSSLTANSIDGSVDDEVTGLWEISVVPTSETVEMQSNQHNDIGIGVWKNASGVLIDHATNATRYTIGSSSTENNASGYSSTSNGQVYGNGTKNPVLGYAVKNGASGDTIETAQMK